MPSTRAAIYINVAANWIMACTIQSPGNEPSRIMIPPTGKKKPKATVARTAWAMSMVRYREKLPKLPKSKSPPPLEGWMSETHHFP
jgi:hypothetical protein